MFAFLPFGNHDKQNANNSRRPQSRASRGRAAAQLMRHCWRGTAAEPAEFDFERDEAAISVLLQQGAGALLWQRLQHSREVPYQLKKKLKQASREQVVRFVAMEERIALIVSQLQRGGVDPILVKGWSAARRYSEPRFRTPGDVDICVPPQQMGDAIQLLDQMPADLAYHVDLHSGLPDLQDTDCDQAYQRSELVQLGDGHVRVLGVEDHIRLLCLHFVRHLGVRPMSLCDVAAALESTDRAIDWEYCLRGAQRLREWILIVISVTRDLLGAEISAEAEPPAISVPSWVSPYLLRVWADKEITPRNFGEYFQKPSNLLRFVEYRNLNPMRSADRMRLRPTLPWAMLQTIGIIGRLLGPAKRLHYCFRFLWRRQRVYDVH